MQTSASRRSIGTGVVRSASLALVVAVAASIGCRSSAPTLAGKSVGQTSEVVPTPAFEAPFDPDMGAITLVVAPIEVSAPYMPGSGDVGRYVRSQFVSAFGASRNFTVADPEAYDEIARQFELAESGAMRPEDLPRFGELVGARFIVKVDLTELQESVVGSAKSSKVETGPIASFISIFLDGTIGTILRIFGAANPTVANEDMTIRGVVGLEVRLTDVSTGAVHTVARAQSTMTRANSSSIVSVAGIETGDSRFEQTVVAHATRAAVEDAVLKLHAALRGESGGQTAVSASSAAPAHSAVAIAPPAPDAVSNGSVPAP